VKYAFVFIRLAFSVEIVSSGTIARKIPESPRILPNAATQQQRYRGKGDYVVFSFEICAENSQYCAASIPFIKR
jgi:hypothetical protein